MKLRPALPTQNVSPAFAGILSVVVSLICTHKLVHAVVLGGVISKCGRAK